MLQHSGVRKALFFTGLLGAWAVFSVTHIWPPNLFPSPMGVLGALADGFRDKSLLFGIASSMKRILVGYCISLILGVGLGVLLGRSRLLQDTVGSLMVGLRSLPSICWLPLTVLWFGMSEMAIQFVVIMGAFQFIAMATEDGIRNIPPLYTRAALTMGTSRWDTITRVVLPAALPSVTTGMKLGWAFAWRSLMAGELLFVSMGLGHLLQMGRELNDMSLVVAVMIVIIVIGLIVDKLIFARLEKIVQERWGTAK